MASFYVSSTGETAWRKKDLEDKGIPTNNIMDIEIPSITSLVQGYYEFRGLKYPSPTEALLFLVSEVGELADQLVARIDGWVRNDPNKPRGTNILILYEIGDILMMTTMVIFHFGADPLDAMILKFVSKGWSQE